MIEKIWKKFFFQGSPLWNFSELQKMQIFHAFCSFVIFWDTDIPNMSNWMVLYSNLKFGWGLAPSSPPPPPPCWASRCSWRSPWSQWQISDSSSIFPSNICMSFNLRYCFWVSDNKQRNYNSMSGPPSKFVVVRQTGYGLFQKWSVK